MNLIRRIYGFFVLLLISVSSYPQADAGIYLLVRGDDIGSSHTANVACIESYRNGIVRSVELMVPGPWFPEAVRLLNENPGLDVGVHLVMTSEWNDIKWCPLTCCPSLVDIDGYFFVEHPGMNTTEMQAIWHKGYENVASDRDAVTKVFTSKEVMGIIRSREIILVSYKEAK
jgi:hypothetical protein